MTCIRQLLAAVGAALCVGCDDGRITLSITDAPIDFADEVVVQFSGVAFERDDRTREVIEFATPLRVDLAQLTGELSESLLVDEPLPASGYRAIELLIDGSQTGGESFVQLNDGSTLSLYVPDAFEDDLRVPVAFTVDEESSVALTVDFDLRRSLFRVDDAVELRPALRVVADEDAASVTGAIADNLLRASCTPAVYVYEGTQVDPDDVGGTDDEPFSSAIATVETGSGARRYTIGFLEAGDYTLALTCDAGIDEPDTDDDVSFIRELEVELRAGRRETANFQ